MDKLQDVVAAHPKLFRSAQPEVLGELPAGWYVLVNELCSNIEALLGPESKRFRVLQIKEKFGGLRFYFSLAGAEDEVIDILTPRGVQTVVLQDANGPSTMSELRTLVAAASAASTSLCQTCGAYGTLAVRQGWASTFCETHSADRAGGYL